VERKNVESIAYQFGHARLPLQGFIGWAPGTMRRCVRSCLGKLASNWDRPMACWSSTPRAFPSPGASR
jgi:hypothetical protein